ncbi:hypothetical protein H9Y04_36465 [Streptomyces sp. TRM66268-LWL]|uniref:Uncharacterized protein n=1 Tax=Streptomyces polyasparticus TaxID=2767826 RepID=A0ABR7SR99_9ACTN|nr:hypothetical protein [Streptomyces polyasparticus]MBC9718042.1 hypothetical protein [Streptomyces polyasparticus]
MPTNPLPTTLWIPASDEATDTPAGHVLPDWAVARAELEFCARTGHRRPGMLRVAIADTGCGMDARTSCTAHDSTGCAQTPGRPAVILAELHPDTVPSAPVSTAYGPGERGAIDDGWPGFFHRAHRVLPADGLLLIAARQRRESGRLTDPLGLLIATARTAGFRYLQHIAVVHGHLDGDRINPAPPDPGTPELIHSDLLVLSPVRTAQ